VNPNSLVRWSCLAFVVVFAVFASAQDNTSELTSEARVEIDHRIHLQRSFDGRINSPGAELRSEEVKRLRMENGVRVIKYEFVTKGLPSGLGYDFLVLPTMAGREEEIQSTGEVLIDTKDGRVIDGPDDPRSIVVPDPAPGEPYRFALVSKDSKYRALLTLLPNAIEGSDQGCKVTVIRLMPNFELAFVRITGFPPETEVAVRGDSEGEVHDFKMTTDAKGYADIGILPAKKGKSKGKMEMHFTSPKCAPKANFKWGSTEDGKPYQ
jgi:hypothetical protein